MQGTEEWKESRRGKVTASHIADIMATGKGGKPSASRENYLIEKALERVTGNHAPDSFKSAAMQRGTELEPIARAEYELATGSDVDEVDLIDHPTLPNTGASPDGRVSVEGMVEIKCPEQKQHLVTLRTREIKREYMLQMQWQMECDRRQWCDFVSYNPDYPEKLRMVVIRVERNERLLEEIRAAVIAAEEDIVRIVVEITDMEEKA